MHATIEELLEAVFSVRTVPRMYSESHGEKLVTRVSDREFEDSWDHGLGVRQSPTGNIVSGRGHSRLGRVIVCCNDLQIS